MKQTLLVLALGASQFLVAQQVVYFNENWEVVKNKKQASYYRETAKQGNLTLIKDYYISGALQSEGLASDATPQKEIYEGKVTWYYPSGKVESFAHFKNGKKLGEQKIFSETGELIQFFSYDANGNFSGKEYTPRFDEESLNIEAEYKNGKKIKEIYYDKSLQDIRIEYIYDDNEEQKETKYYGDGGKYLGASTFTKNYELSGVEVQYYYNPFRVSCINVHDEKIIGYKEQKCYYGNGKLKYEFVGDDKTGIAITYDENGSKLGQISYKYDEEYGFTPYEGVYVGINLFSPNKEVSDYTIYQKGYIVQSDFYREGELESISYRDKEGNIKELISYQKGKQVAKLVYQDAMPYEGKSINKYMENSYSKGVLVEEKTYDGEGNIISDRKLDRAKNQYETKIFESDGKLKFFYTMHNTSSDDILYGFTGEITPYDSNGKALNKVIVNDGLIEKGKLRIDFDGYSEEYERKGDWIYKRTYEDKKLTSENKSKIDSSNIYEFTINEGKFIRYVDEGDIYY